MANQEKAAWWLAEAAACELRGYYHMAANCRRIAAEHTG